MPDCEIARLLVVDDEDVICQGCRRIFSPQGFQVETTSDAHAALTLASGQDFAAILLDVKMPAMTGIEFLQRLRASKPDVPVILITGYPCVPDAAAAMRLGASDYVTKPFSPEEITQAVRRCLGRAEAAEKAATDSPPAESATTGPWASGTREFRFVDESWLQRAPGRPIRVGAILSPADEMTLESVSLPQVGETLYQGLPLAGLFAAGKLQRTLPAPVTGIVVAVNDVLLEHPSALWDDPFGRGWIALVSPERLDEEAALCEQRRVILANANRESSRMQSAELIALGCQVRVVTGGDELSAALPGPDCRVLLVDATSLGQRGPELIVRVHAASPGTRAVVIADASSQGESVYRAQPIFYYAVEPFADREIVDILNAAFRSQRQTSVRGKRRKVGPECSSSIFVANHLGEHVGLFLAGGLTSEHDGLGWHVRQKLLDQFYPVRTASDLGRISQAKLVVAASMCDRLLIVLPRDMGRLPGSLVGDTKTESALFSGEAVGKTAVLAVQPACPGGKLTGFDERTMAALADHIVRAIVQRDSRRCL